MDDVVAEVLVGDFLCTTRPLEVVVAEGDDVIVVELVVEMIGVVTVAAF